VTFDLHTLRQAIESLYEVGILFNFYIVVLEPELGEGPASTQFGVGKGERYLPGDVFLVMAAHAFPQPLERHLVSDVH